MTDTTANHGRTDEDRILDREAAKIDHLVKSIRGLLVAPISNNN
jgi:hypothetical protein